MRTRAHTRARGCRRDALPSWTPSRAGALRGPEPPVRAPCQPRGAAGGRLPDGGARGPGTQPRGADGPLRTGQPHAALPRPCVAASSHPHRLPPASHRRPEPTAPAPGRAESPVIPSAPANCAGRVSG